MKIPRSPSMTLIYGFLIPFGAYILFSCSSKQELISHIPKDASAVMTIDVKNLALKSLDFKQMLTLDNLRKFIGNIGEKKDSVAASIANSGLDFTSTIYLFGQIQELSKYGAAVAKLSDATKFGDFIKTSYPAMVITEEDGMKFAKFTNNKGILGWNKDEVFVVFGDPLPKERVLALANLKKEESLSETSASFKESQQTSADILFWISFADLAKSIPQYGANFKMMNLKDTYVSAACNFEDGQIVIDTKYTTNPESAARYNFVKPGVNMAVIKTLPGEPIIGLVGFSLDMDKVYKQLEQQGVVQPYNQSATKATGLSIRQIMTLFSGDVTMTLNGLEMKDGMALDPITRKLVSKRQPVPDYSVVLGIADKERLFKLLDQLTKSGMLLKRDNSYTVQNKVFVFEKGPAVVITGSEARMRSFKNTGGEKLSADLATMLSENSSSMYFNPGLIPDDVFGTQVVVRDNLRNSEVQSITVMATSVKKTTSTMKIVVAFKNKGENALVTIGRVAKKFKGVRVQPEAPSGVRDSTAMPGF